MLCLIEENKVSCDYLPMIQALRENDIARFQAVATPNVEQTRKNSTVGIDRSRV